MTEMISLYLTQTTSLIAAMNQSLQSNDWNELQAIAHKMISSFSIMGISKDYENLAKKIQEYASTQQHTEKIPDFVLQLTGILTQVCEELHDADNVIKETNK
jgi:HPt (histidine-containing phosphotransfer) domain-containing protein